MKAEMKRKNQSGFTLLELIIVLIIIAVLASLALPRFIAAVERSKANEALNAMGMLRASMERCYLQNSNVFTGCNMASLDVQNPGQAAGTHFTYAITVDSPTGYTMVATRNSFDQGNGTDTITIVQTATTVTRNGTGAFIGI